MLTFGSLFSGIGGFDLGLERVGMKCKWQVEIDEYATKILEKHWPKVRRYKDIKEVKELEYVDVICGGFPCQDISNAGKRAGITGERSSLWKEYLRVIRMVRPKYVIVENVAALINRGLDTVLADLASCGMDAEWDCIPASSIGAPHRRDRVFIIGTYRNTDSYNVMQVSEVRKGKETIASRICEIVAYPDNRCEQKHEIQTRRDTFKSGGQDMADTNSMRMERSWSEQQTTRIKRKSKDVPDSNCKRLQRNIKKEPDEWKQKKEPRCRSDIIPDTYDFNYWKQRQKSIQEANRRKYWATDAGILRVANGIPRRLYCIMDQKRQAPNQNEVDTINEFNWKIMRSLWEKRETSKTPSKLRQDGVPDIMSDRPQEYTHEEWYLGQRIEEDEELRYMWETVCTEPQHETQDMREELLEQIREIERIKTLETKNRISRIKCLGNAIVPQVAEFIGERVVQLDKVRQNNHNITEN